MFIWSCRVSGKTMLTKDKVKENRDEEINR